MRTGYLRGILGCGVVVSVVVSLTGCYQMARQARLEKEHAHIDAKAAGMTFELVCRDGRPWGTRCGLVANEIVTAAFRERFKAKVCAELDDDACERKRVKMIAARWINRYPYADAALAQRLCDADPETCPDIRKFEEYLLRSHNREVDAMAELAKADASRQADADVEQNRRAMGEALQKAATQMGGGVVCDTQPSVTGGSYTTCNR